MARFSEPVRRRERFPAGSTRTSSPASRESVTVPAPPAPSARFRVMDERTTVLLERVSRAEPDSHLLLGILYTQAGAREEAEAQLRLVPPSNPYASVASRTLEHLQEPAVGR